MRIRGSCQAGAQSGGLLSTSSSKHVGHLRSQHFPALTRPSSRLRCDALATTPLQSGCRQQRAPACLPSPPNSVQQQSLKQQRQGVVSRAIAGTLTATGIIPLGYDFLTFLTATVMVVPACKWLKISPVLGFLAAGVALEQAG